MFEFQCDVCSATHSGDTINEATLGMVHRKRCDVKLGVPIHYTRINTVSQQYICENCEADNCKECTGRSEKGACECCYGKNFE